ncbi:MFS transporter [Phyllobacterium myrsinacearum]|uniref:PPP family 3-phenylpropionic acid transporter n=1 Tax=Phyllobacterium myrsinacearum TaxID=28101 RepID=A0A839EEF1_9HYPH|nr:MFS transporter [Phyllobacterium myrsinacearum]MBA8878473.1 PPP family 3-phenylpropionic acid transporter [Phyllobacterium myrsinacearum]
MTAAAADTFQDKPSRFELRLALAYFAIFISSGLHLPYFPLWLEFRSLSPTEISIVLSMPLFVRVIAAPLVSILADQSNDRAHILTIATILAVIVAAFYFLPFNFFGILMVSLLLAAPWTSQVPLADTIALSGVRRYGADFARMRVWGSIAFLLASFAGGVLIQHTGEWIIPTVLLCALVAACGMSFVVPRIGKPRRLSPLSDIDMANAGRALRRPAFVTFLIATGITQASHAYGYSFSAIYWKSIGIEETVIGALWSIAVVAEVIMFTCFRRFFGRLHPARVLMIGSAVAIFRWTVFPLIIPAGFGVAGFFVVQSLHSFSFALSFLGMQKMIAMTIPEERGGTAQGISTFFIGTSLAIVTMVSGPLYSATGIYGFYAMVALAAVGFFLANVSLKLEQREH